MRIMILLNKIKKGKKEQRYLELEVPGSTK